MPTSNSGRFTIAKRSQQLAGKWGWHWLGAKKKQIIPSATNRPFGERVAVVVVCICSKFFLIFTTVIAGVWAGARTLDGRRVDLHFVFSEFISANEFYARCGAILPFVPQTGRDNGKCCPAEVRWTNLYKTVRA